MRMERDRYQEISNRCSCKGFKFLNFILFLALLRQSLGLFDWV